MSCGETCSTHGCNESKGCAAYTHRDSLAERIERDLYEPVDVYRLTDVIGVVLIVGVLAWLVMGG